MAERFRGRLRLPTEGGPGIQVEIDLTDDEHLRVRSGEVEIGDWELSEVTVKAGEDGFHLFVEGEEAVVTTDDDPGFAIALKVWNAPPLLRRRISERMRQLGLGSEVEIWND
jgi:hypothetical protein